MICMLSFPSFYTKRFHIQLLQIYISSQQDKGYPCNDPVIKE